MGAWRVIGSACWSLTASMGAAAEASRTRLVAAKRVNLALSGVRPRVLGPALLDEGRAKTERLSRACVHEAALQTGGPRMCGVRAKVSRMSIGAPQSRQIKVGGRG